MLALEILSSVLRYLPIGSRWRESPSFLPSTLGEIMSTPDRITVGQVHKHCDSIAGALTLPIFRPKQLTSLIPRWRWPFTLATSTPETLSHQSISRPAELCSRNHRCLLESRVPLVSWPRPSNSARPELTRVSALLLNSLQKKVDFTIILNRIRLFHTRVQRN